MSINNKAQSLNIVLCLAGKGQRFIDRGYTTPKFLLKDIRNSETILNLIIKNFCKSGVSKFFLVLNKQYKKWEVDIKQSISSLKNLDYCLLYIGDTSGQAETAYLGIELIKKNALIDSNDPIGFHNGDTVLFQRNFKSTLDCLNDEVDGAIDTFPASSNAYSYVKTSKKGFVTEIQEKNVISHMASSGLYIFKNFDTFIKNYEDTVFVSKEKYISAIYQRMLSKKLKIFNLHNNDEQKTLILGTPIEYERWKLNG